MFQPALDRKKKKKAQELLRKILIMNLAVILLLKLKVRTKSPRRDRIGLRAIMAIK